MLIRDISLFCLKSKDFPCLDQLVRQRMQVSPCFTLDPSQRARERRPPEGPAIGPIKPKCLMRTRVCVCVCVPFGIPFFTFRAQPQGHPPFEGPMILTHTQKHKGTKLSDLSHPLGTRFRNTCLLGRLESSEGSEWLAISAPIFPYCAVVATESAAKVSWALVCVCVCVCGWWSAFLAELYSLPLCALHLAPVRPRHDARPHAAPAFG